jgi:hypothetical protein
VETPLALPTFELSGTGFGLTLEIPFIGQQPLGHGAKPEGIKRLDHPSIGPGFTGEKNIGLTVQQQPDGPLVEPERPLLLADGDAGGDPAHAADLKIEKHQIRVLGPDNRQNVGPFPNPEHLAIVAGKGGIHLGEDMI